MPNNEKPYQGNHKATMEQVTAKAWPYPAYKDSGVECLGQVPEHWTVRRMATVADIRVSNVDKHSKEGELPVRLCNYVDVYHNEQISADVPFMAGTAKREEIQKFRLALGDVLVTKDSEDWKDIGVPALVAYAADDLVCGYHLAMLRPQGKSLDGGYLSYALRNQHVAWQCQVAAVGVTRYGLSQNAIKSMKIPLPPLSEQTAIAHFLDHATQRIQRHIQAKQKLIKLLEEQKQVIIHQAVTGQINVQTGQPYPAYKDSGVEWLGKVPEHWGTGMVKRGYDIKLGKMLQTKPNSANDIEVSYLKAKDVQWFNVQPISGARMWASPGDIEQFSVSGGDLLVCEGGEGGRCGILTGEVNGHIIQNSLHRVRPRDGNSNAFLQYTMRAIAETGWFVALNNKATIAHFTYEKFGALRIPFPSPPEQTAIANFLTHTTQRIEKHCATVKRTINLLHEYRTRLIADVVTGKLDVREAAARLPQSDPLPTTANCQDGTELAAPGRSPRP